MLAEIFQELNEQHFGGELPLPSLAWNPRLSTTAGRFCPGSRRAFFPRAPKIEVASYLRELADGQDHVRDTILHEMIHFYLWHHEKPYGHTPEFHRIMKRVGAQRFNPVPKVRPVKYWYECPNCRKKIPARRKMERYACATCCDAFAGGSFRENFRLRRIEGAQAALPPKAAVATIERTSPPALQKENAPLPPEEIVRRLEELKKLLFRG